MAAPATSSEILPTGAAPGVEQPRLSAGGRRQTRPLNGITTGADRLGEELLWDALSRAVAAAEIAAARVAVADAIDSSAAAFSEQARRGEHTVEAAPSARGSFFLLSLFNSRSATPLRALTSS